MDLQKLFKIQAKLDNRIVKEHGLQGKDLLNKKILALQVELGELAQNWRGFKFWSEDQKPRVHVNTGICLHCAGTGNAFYDDEEEEIEGCGYCFGGGEEISNPLLEEYVDCLHFILSIGLELDYQDVDPYAMNTSKDVVTEFNLLFANVSSIWLSSITVTGIKHHIKGDYQKVFSIFLVLGELLGFNFSQIEQAYLDKNKINHERQDGGY